MRENCLQGRACASLHLPASITVGTRHRIDKVKGLGKKPRPRLVTRHSIRHTAMTREKQLHLLRQAAGFLELGELLVEPDQPVPPASLTVLRHALQAIESIEPPLRQEPETMLLEAETLRALGQFEAALPLFRRTAAAVPRRIEPWLGIGWCLKRLNRLDEAIEQLQAGMRASPRQPILHYNLACYLSLAGEGATAIRHLTKAIALDKRFRDLTQLEPDFDPIRSDPQFVAVTHLAC